MEDTLWRRRTKQRVGKRSARATGSSAEEEEEEEEDDDDNDDEEEEEEEEEEEDDEEEEEGKKRRREEEEEEEGADLPAIYTQSCTDHGKTPQFCCSILQTYI